MLMDEQSKKCCANCAFFEARTGFCRLNPPQVVPQFIKSVGQVNSAVWPKIPLPNIDWCGNHKLKFI